MTIIPRGAAALGITMTRPLEDRYVVTEPQLKDQMAFAMGGQAAEEIYFDGVISTGAQNDLEKATDLARAMVSQFGMSENGRTHLARQGRPERMDAGRDAESERAHRRADRQGGPATAGRGPRSAREKILKEHRELLNRLSALLIATEVIDGDELKAYFEGRKEIPESSDDQADAEASALTRTATRCRPSRPSWPARSRCLPLRRCPPPTSCAVRLVVVVDGGAGARPRVAGPQQIPAIAEPVEEPVEVLLRPSRPVFAARC